MRILFVSQTSPFREGGIETRSREVAIRMASAGHEIVYLCAKTKVDETPTESRDGITLFRKKILPDWLLKRLPFPNYFTLACANLFMGFHLVKLLRKESFDVIREEISPVPISSLLAFIGLPTRRIAIVHGLSVHFRDWRKLYGAFFGLYGYWMERCLRRGWFRYDRIMVPARWYAKELEASPPIAPMIDWIPNGVNLPEFVSAELRPPPVQIRKLVNIGRLVPNKGHIYLLQGFAEAKKAHPEITLTILGKGPLEACLRQEAKRLGLESSVEFLAYLPEKEIAPFYRRFDLLVMPSLLEGFNLVILEAMASGLPVLASDIPGFSDVLEGLDVPRFRAADSADLGAAISALVAEPQRVGRSIEAGWERVKKFDWQNAARRETQVLSGSETLEFRDPQTAGE